MKMLKVFLDEEAPGRIFGEVLADGEVVRTMDIAELAIYFGEQYRAEMALQDCRDMLEGDQ